MRHSILNLNLEQTALLLYEAYPSVTGTPLRPKDGISLYFDGPCSESPVFTSVEFNSIDGTQTCTPADTKELIKKWIDQNVWCAEPAATMKKLIGADIWRGLIGIKFHAEKNPDQEARIPALLRLEIKAPRGPLIELRQKIAEIVKKDQAAGEAPVVTG